MTDHDRTAENGDGEPVVIRDRRRIDPDTGEVRVPSDVESDGAVPPAEETVDPRVDDLTAEVAERTADLQRVSAEYANYRRRVDRDRESVLVGARVQFVSELLTVLDDLDRAESHGDLTGAFKAVGDKITSVVQKLGLESFGLDGEPFDPSVHEAVQHDTSEAGSTSVSVLSAVLRRGYRIGDRVLRPAMVTVVDRADASGYEDPPVDESTET